MALTLVKEEPEDNGWLEEDVRWDAIIMAEMGYLDSKQDWEDFQDYLIEHAMAWMQTKHDEKHHSE